MINNLEKTINAAWDQRELLESPETQDAVRAVIEELDKGRLRVAHPDGDSWIVN